MTILNSDYTILRLPPVLEMEMWLCQIFKDLRVAPSCFKDPSGTRQSGGPGSVTEGFRTFESVDIVKKEVSTNRSRSKIGDDGA
jgi:hypothetical protein